MNKFLKSSILSIGFRPFFLLASLLSFMLIGFWVLIFVGVLKISLLFDPITWHSHEMLFGFALSVLMGFLLTASQNWSGRRGLHGLKLLFLVMLLVAGRFGSFNLVFQYLELFVIPVLTYFLFPYLWGEEKTRNRKILYMLGALWGCDLLIHFGDSQLGRTLAVDIFLGFVILIAGRIIPFFRSRVLDGPKVENSFVVENVSTALFIVYVLSSFIESSIIRSSLASLVFVSQFIRWYRWMPLKSLQPPILGIIYLGYFWLLMGFLSIALGSLFAIGPSVSIHFFTVGGLGVVMFAMMTRVSLGHTGRPIKASALTLFAYFILNLAVIVRTVLPIFWPETYLLFISVSGVLWCLAFGLYFIEFLPILITARLDEVSS